MSKYRSGCPWLLRAICQNILIKKSEKKSPERTHVARRVGIFPYAVGNPIKRFRESDSGLSGTFGFAVWSVIFVTNECEIPYTRDAFQNKICANEMSGNEKIVFMWYKKHEK